MKRPVLFLCLSTLVMVILFAFGLLDFLYEIGEKNGFSLRILDKLESGEIATSTSREKIAARVWEHTLQSPVFGMGLFADRRVAGGSYAHNIALEILIQFGLVFGSALLGIMIFMLVGSYRYLRKSGQTITLDFFGAVVFSFAFKLMLSDSYLTEPYFFMVLGFAGAVMSDRKWDKKREKLELERKSLVRLRRIHR